ncbi:retrovirus-related pol polyprotein from transposon TNT 1-94 [Tanacetum coccineum]
MAAGYSDDALFHATYCKEELDRFRLCSGKVRLADDKILDIASVGDVFLKTSFGTSWTLKDVRYISGLKRRLISVGQLDEEGYHVGFRDQQCFQRQRSRCTKGRYLLHNVTEDKETAEVGATGVAIVPKTPLQFGVAERLSRTFRAESKGIRAEAPKMLWADSVSTAYLIYCIPYILIGLRIPEEEWRGKDTSLTHLKEAAQMKCDTAFRIQRVTRLSEAEISHLWTRFMKPENDSLVAEHGLSSEITQSLGGSSDTSEGSENSESFEDSGRSDEEDSEDREFSDEGGFETPQRMVNQSYLEALSSKEFVQWKKTINEEMVSLEKNQTYSLVRISAGKKASQKLWMFKVKEEQDGSKRYKALLMVKGFQQKHVLSNCEDGYNQPGFSASWARRKPRVHIEGNSVLTDFSTKATIPLVLEMKDRYSEKQVLGYVLTVGVTTVEVLIFVEDSWNEEPCSDVHQVGDEIEVKVLRSFNWPPIELITEDGFLPERVCAGAIYRTEVCTEDSPTIDQLPNIVLVDNKSDNLVLRSREGKACRFSVKQAYKDLQNDVGNAHWISSPWYSTLEYHEVDNVVRRNVVISG